MTPPIDGLDAAAVLSRVDRVQLRKLAYAQSLRNSYPDFMRWAFPLTYRRQIQWNWHLGALAEHLQACKERQIKRLVVNVHPRSLKSWTIGVGFPAWWWTDDPRIQFLAASADKDVVFRDADAHRDLCKSPEYQALFRPTWSFKSAGDGTKQEAKGYYRNSAGGHRLSRVIGKKGTGADADVLLIDDPLDPSDAYTDKAGLVDHLVIYRQRLVTRLNDPETGIVIIVMQRLHELDLSGDVLKEDGWEHLCLPAEYDGKKRFTILGPYDPRTVKGEIMFPARFSPEFLAQKKIDLGARGYAGQYQQAPAPAAGAIVLKKWIEYWIPSKLPEMTYTIGSWDCTFGSKTADADYVVGQTWGVSGDNVYLLDQVRRKMSLPEMLEAIREQDRIWPGLRAVVVEEKAAGKDVIDTLEREVYGIEPYRPKSTSKQERLHAGLALWEQHRVYLPHPMHASVDDNDYSWVKDFYVPELLTFPGAAHDDQVDATSQALIWIMANGNGEGCGIEVLG